MMLLVNKILLKAKTLNIFYFILLVSLIFANYTMAKNQQVDLYIVNKSIMVNGKAINLHTIVQKDGTWGYYGTKGDYFNVVVHNELQEPSVIHWHGMMLPNSQDGTELTQNYIDPQKSYKYNYLISRSGTLWMHSHYGFQEQTLVSAPLIIYPKNYDSSNDIVIMFQDFSYKSPEQTMKDLHKNNSMDDAMSINHHNMSDMNMKMDLNDVDYDAFLANYKTLDNPELHEVKPGETYNLRFINAAAATNFWINLGKLTGKVVAVDGNSTTLYSNSKFQLALANRLDIKITIPAEGGVFPILGVVEGKKAQTGIILYTKGNKVSKINTIAAEISPALSYDQENNIKTDKPFSYINSKVNQTVNLVLNGDMKNYIWTINGKTWPKIDPINIKKDNIVQINFINNSGMSHPMHLHGYVFEVKAINGKSITNGQLKDTILVQPHSSVSVIFKADATGKWLLHCHMLYHMHSSMMTYINVI